MFLIKNFEVKILSIIDYIFGAGFFSLIIFLFFYSSIPQMQSDDYQRSLDEDEDEQIWDRW
jgi:hypothetical protein